MDRTMAQPSRWGIALTHLFAEWARPLRFVIVGGICGAVQLALLGLFLRSGSPAIPANVAAFLLSAQVNFALSSFFTWHDRANTGAAGHGLIRQWLRFHGSIAGGALVNQAVFLLARSVAPDLTAAALGIGVAAVTNYLLQDRLVFRHNAATPAAVRSTPDTGTAEDRRPSFSIVNGTAVEDEVTLRRSRPISIARFERPSPQQEPGLRHTMLPRVDVVIPVYNDEQVLASSVHRLHAFLTERLPYDWRIVIADNASTDGTLTVAGALRERLDRVAVLHLDQKGRGRALRRAWLESDADVLSYMDVDLSTDLSAYPPLIEAITGGGADLATGRRLGAGARVEQRRLLREITSRGYNLLIALVFRPRFTDAQCGFKAITREAAQTLLPRVKNEEWFFDTELLILSDRHGYRIAQIPVHWIDDPDSRVNVTRTAMEDIKGLWRLKRAGP